MRWTRTSVLDEYLEGDELAVMTTEGVVVALSPLAASALQALENGAGDEAGVAEELVRRFGPPSGADLATNVEAVMSALSDLGLAARDSDG